MSTVDFGFVEATRDFTASDQLSLLNASGSKLKITNIYKSCRCYSVLLDPDSEVLPGNSLKVSFRHSDVTLNKGGLFYDKIGIGLSDAENRGITFIEYLGYVIRSAISIPRQIDFHHVRPADIGNSLVVILALPKIRLLDGRPALVTSREVISLAPPDYLDAKVVDVRPGYDIYQHLPHRSISDSYIRKLSDGTVTKQQLKRLMATQDDNLLSAEDLWRPVAIKFQLKSLPDTDFTGAVEVQTDIAPVSLPVSITLASAFQVLPQRLFWAGNASAPIRLRIRSNLSKPSADAIQVRPAHPSLTLRTDESSANEWVGFVSINRELINEYTLKTEIQAISSSGKINISVTVLE